MEGATGGWRFRSFWTWQRCAGHACDRCEVAACQDRGADAGERFLRNGSTYFWLQGLKNKTECLGTPMQIVDHSRPVTRLIGRGPRINIVHSVSHGIVEQNCDLAGRGRHGLGL